MTHPLSFEHLQAILRQHTAGLPNFRKPSPNTRYTVHWCFALAFATLIATLVMIEHDQI